MTISHEAIQELQWWVDNLEKWNGVSMLAMLPQNVIHTDVSKPGWSFVLDNAKIWFGLFTAFEQSLSNNSREMLAVKKGLIKAAYELANKCIHLYTDNLTTLSYINSQGGKSLFLTSIAKDIWEICFSNGISLQVHFIPGVQNRLADEWSRKAVHRYDFQIEKASFRKIDKKWGPHTVDEMLSL